MIEKLNDDEVKTVELEGEFVWHTHDTDELFLAVAGPLTAVYDDCLL